MTRSTHILLAVLGLALIVLPNVIPYADAQGSGSGSAIVEVGSGSAVPVVVIVTPADKLHDPLKDPQAVIDDIKAAKRLGWGVVVFLIVTLAARLAGSLGKSIKFLAPLGKGKLAIAIGAAAAVGAAAYNTAMEGGSGFALIAAAAAAGLAAWNAAAVVPKADA